jgi:3-methylfumaryl-CoA hydratase
MTANQTFRVCGRLTEAGFEGVTLDAADRVSMRARTTDQDAR